jgi:CubicO group peptidase (beta-lactamase class C family)
MKTLARWVLAFALVVAGAAMVAIIWLTRLPPSSGDIADDLQRVVVEFVAANPSVKNCVVSVAKGDGSFAWSGAAGTASRREARPMIVDAPIFIASVTKLYTATVVMALVEKGTLALDDPMAKYLPEDLVKGIQTFGGKDYSGEITVRELLSHTSGIADYYDEKGSDGKTVFDLLREHPERPWTVDAAIARARDDLKPNFAPGTRASYSDTNYQLLGKVIEAATGAPLDQAFDTMIFAPLGLKHTWLLGHPLSSNAPASPPADIFDGETDITSIRFSPAYWADGGIVSTAPEMLTFLTALNQGRIIRRDTLGQMHDWRDLRFPLQYGFGTMRFHLPWPAGDVAQLPPLWGHSGSTGSFLYYSPDLDLYLAGTIDQTQNPAKPFALLRAIARATQSYERAKTN